MKRHFEFASNIEKEKINNAVLVEVECSKTGGAFCDMMGVSGFPTIMLVHQGKAMKYTNGRTHGAIVQFLSDKSQWIMDDLPPRVEALAHTLNIQPTGTDDEDEDDDDDEDDAVSSSVSDKNEEL
jgi:hypothetical protein